MAGTDYLCCAECGTRLLYDGDRSLRLTLAERGEFALVCSRCASKLKKMLARLKKFDKRRH